MQLFQNKVESLTIYWNEFSPKTKKKSTSKKKKKLIKMRVMEVKHFERLKGNKISSLEIILSEVI